MSGGCGLGIAHQRIHPGQPQENGAHERMHRTMKRRAIKPVQRTCASQQKNFDAFRVEYNTERPHEALLQETPATHYTTSPRQYPSTLPTLEYPLHFLVKKVTDAGTFRFQKRLLYIANSLVDQHIGLEETGRSVCAVVPIRARTGRRRLAAPRTGHAANRTDGRIAPPGPAAAAHRGGQSRAILSRPRLNFLSRASDEELNRVIEGLNEILGA